MHIKESTNNIIEETCSISEIESKIIKYYISRVYITDLVRIFENKDVYIQYFLLTKNKATNFTIHKKVVKKIIKMIKKIKRVTIVKYNKVKLSKTMIKWIKKNLKNFVNLNDIFLILNYCSLKVEDTEFFRKNLGYNLIYKEYKKSIENQIAKNLPSILILLNNNKICHNKLLEIYKNLDFYLENKVLDKNFIFCCKILYNLINYDISIFQANLREFILGFSIYLLDLIYVPDTIRIFSLRDIEFLVELINAIYRSGNEKYKRGVFLRCIKAANNLLTNIYEDTVMLIVTLQILDNSDKLFITFDNANTFCDNLECFKLSKSFQTFKEYKFIVTRFFKYKYKVLSKILPLLNREFDRIKIYNELYEYDNYNRIILKNCTTNIFNYIIDNLFILVDNSKNKIQYINILFDRFSEQDISYMYLYLLSLKNNTKHVLYFTVYFTNIKVTNEAKYFEMLMMIYFMFIDIEDVYINKSRLVIFKTINRMNNIDFKYIKKEIQKYNKKNKNVFILLYFAVDKILTIDKTDFLCIYNYLLEDLGSLNSNKPKNNLTRFKKKTPTSLQEQSFSFVNINYLYKLQYFYYTVLVDLLDKCEDKNIVEVIHKKSFDSLSVLLLYFQKKKMSYDNIMNDIFNFVFTCKKQERKKLYKLIFCNNTKNKYEKIRSKYKFA